jgi:hypothetical protein
MPANESLTALRGEAIAPREGKNWQKIGKKADFLGETAVNGLEFACFIVLYFSRGSSNRPFSGGIR